MRPASRHILRGSPFFSRLLAAFAIVPITLLSAATPIEGPVARELVLEVNFDEGLGPFGYDDTWGCGFGKQSDFMGDLRQVSIHDAVATITAERRATPCGREFASAVMSTRETFSQAFGYFEARIRYDGGNGLWPAFWLHPADGSWPPEIDVMEAYPNENGAWPGPTRYMATLHYGADNRSIDIVPDLKTDLPGTWHTYGVDWTPGSLAFFFDGQEIGRITEHIPSTEMYLILNLAVGSWTAPADPTTPDITRMEIDFVRVWR